MVNSLVIAIDGPAASGKGTIGRRLAAHFHLPHLDTGLLYRATAKYLLDHAYPLNDVDHAVWAAQRLADSHLQDPTLRGRMMGEAASRIAIFPEVREALRQFQQDFARKPEGAILDGRDIGTHICPHATLKIFVTASPQVRAHRRTLELQQAGQDVEFEDILADIHARDARDQERVEAPLRPAHDALILDTTHLSLEEAVAEAIQIVQDRGDRYRNHAHPPSRSP